MRKLPGIPTILPLKKLFNVSPREGVGVWRNRLAHYIWSLRKLIIVVAFILVAMLSVIVARWHFSVREIVVSGSDSLLGLTEVKHTLLLTISEADITKRLSRQNPTIKEIYVTKQYPSTLVIQVEKQVPLAIIKVSNGYFYLSNDGTVVEKQRALSRKPLYPLISYYQAFHYENTPVGGQLLSKDLVTGLFFIEKFRYLGLSVVGLDIGGPNMIVLKTDNQKSYIFTTERSKETQFAEFKIVIKRFTIQKTVYQSIDFRFDKPVVRAN